MSTQRQQIYCYLEALTSSINIFELYLEFECFIGRDKNINHIIIDERRVSRIHASITKDGPYYNIEDKSRNGTFINGKKIYGSCKLNHNDKIGIGIDKPDLCFIDLEATHTEPGHLRHEISKRTFYLDGKEVRLKPLHYALLHFLYLRAGTVCSREACIQFLWSPPFDKFRDAELSRIVFDIRKTLREIDANCDRLLSKKSLGYMLCP